MKKKRFSVEQIVGVLKQAEVGVPVAELIRKVGISEQTFYRWKKQYVGLESDQVREMKQLQVVSRVFRTFDLPSYSGRLLGCGCFAPGPHGGQEQSGQAMATISASRSICR